MVTPTGRLYGLTVQKYCTLFQEMFLVLYTWPISTKAQAVIELSLKKKGWYSMRQADHPSSCHHGHTREVLQMGYNIVYRASMAKSWAGYDSLHFISSQT